MKHTQTISCPYYSSMDFVKNGHSENGSQRWCYNTCHKSFQLNHRYNTRKQGVKEQIAVLTLNSSGVRDISRILKINKNTVISELKKTPNLNLYILDMVEDKRLKKLNIEFYYTADPDESWSFVGNKSNQRWTWYAVDKNSGIILDRYNGKRTDEVFLKLVALLSLIPIGMYFTDDWGAYKRYLPENRHYIGKDRIWKIERKNLNFGTHIKRLNRKPICYSRNEHIHDNVTGMYIEQYYFKSGLFLNSA